MVGDSHDVVNVTIFPHALSGTLAACKWVSAFCPWCAFGRGADGETFRVGFGNDKIEGTDLFGISTYNQLRDLTYGGH